MEVSLFDRFATPMFEFLQPERILESVDLRRSLPELGVDRNGFKINVGYGNQIKLLAGGSGDITYQSISLAGLPSEEYYRETFQVSQDCLNRYSIEKNRARIMIRENFRMHAVKLVHGRIQNAVPMNEDDIVGDLREKFRTIGNLFRQNPCEPDPCHSGICIPTFKTVYGVGVMGYQCICSNYMKGFNCNERQNTIQCSDLPVYYRCRHNGTCETFENKYRCRCKEGYTGELCQLVADVCKPGICGQHGICTIGKKMGSDRPYSCHCAIYYHWNEETQECVDVDECKQSHHCASGTRCVNLDPKYTCISDDANDLT